VTRSRSATTRPSGDELLSTGLFGGAFDPPHLGHVEVAREAKRQLDVVSLLVLVAEHPGHKDVLASADERLELARAAFPDDAVRLDPYPRTIDLLRAERFEDPVFVVGADQFAGFRSWKEPEAVLEAATLAVATRPGYPQEALEAVLAGLEHPERVRFFEIAPIPLASRDIRALAAAGAPLVGLVPDAVAALIHEHGLYGAG
jgi:nicotinate-nucleotide adenylyltransferase